MNKILILILLLLAISYSNSFSLEFGSAHQFTIKGGYINCTVYSYNFNKGVVNKKSKLKSKQYKFDIEGNKIEDINYNPVITVGLKNFIPYDIMISEFDNEKSHSDSTYYFQLVYKYNEIGKKIEEISYDSSGVINWKSTFNYDDNGNIIVYLIMNKDNLVYNHQKFIYSDNGFKIKEEILNSEGKIIEKKSYIYFDKANCDYDKIKCEQVRYNDDRTLTTLRTVMYDKNGNILEDIRYSSNGSVHWTLKSKDDIPKIKYDENGNIIEKVEYNKSNKPIMKTEYVYSK